MVDGEALSGEAEDLSQIAIDRNSTKVIRVVLIVSFCALPLAIVASESSDHVAMTALVMGGIVLSFVVLLIIGGGWTYAVRLVRIHRYGHEIGSMSHAETTEMTMIKALQALPTSTRGEGEQADDGEECALCLSELQPGESVRSLPCATSPAPRTTTPCSILVSRSVLVCSR